MDEVRGLRCYPSVLACPGPVDHVISQIPARGVSELVDQCIAKGVRSVHFFTAGFSETGDADMADVEHEIVAKARAAGMRLVGPNCMGLYVPGVGLAFGSGMPTEPGDVFVLSQSGTNASDIVSGLGARGVRFSKAISYGNGADLRAHDFLDYAAADPQTAVVTAYIEGVQDGRAFFEALKRCAAVKPTILLKGGITAAGARAANSHTGSLAGSAEVFEALARQSGAIRAQSMTELHDLVITLSTRLGSLRGRGVALVGAGGGFAVLASDQIALAGLELPPLPEETQRGLREFIPVAGTSVRNPVDAAVARIGIDPDATRRAFTLVARAQPVDVVFTTVGWEGEEHQEGTPEERAERARLSADEFADYQDELDVPFAIIRRTRGEGDRRLRGAFESRAYERGLAVFPSVERAARAVTRLFEWRARREGLPELF